MAATSAAVLALGRRPEPFPATTALGALAHYITEADPRHFVPANIAFGLFPPLEERIRGRRERNLRQAQRALAELATFEERLDLPVDPSFRETVPISGADAAAGQTGAD